MGFNTPLAIYPRHAWAALVPLSVDKMEHPAKYVFCMNTNTHPCRNERQCKGTIRQLQLHQQQRQKHRDIRYNFIIGGDGNVYEGRGWLDKGLLPEKYKEYNDQSIIIGFIGDFTEANLPNAMVNRRNELVSYGVQQNYIAQDFQPFEIFERKNYHNSFEED